MKYVNAQCLENDYNLLNELESAGKVHKCRVNIELNK